MSPIEMSGQTGYCTSQFFNWGILFASLLGLTLGDPKVNDRTIWLYIMLGLPILSCILRTTILCLVFNFDTPTYNIMINDEEKAVQALEKIYKKKFVN